MSGLARENRLLVTRRWGLSRLVYMDYDILDHETREAVGVANESPPLWVLLLGGISIGRFRLRALLPTTLEIREREDGPLLFRLVRQPKIVNFFIQVSIYDGDGKYLGYFQSKLFSFFGGFYIFNSQNEQIGQADFQWRKAAWGLLPGLAVIDRKNRSLGSCYPEGMREVLEGKKRTMFRFGRPNLDLKYDDAIADDPLAKLLFLAAILSMDYTGLGRGFTKNTDA
jgi:hypothetical protein